MVSDIVYDAKTKIFSREFPINIIPENGLGYNLMKKLKTFGNQIAQINALTGETETFSELRLKSVRTAIEMKSRGIKKGDVVGICSYNHMNTVIPYIASQLIGAILSSTDPSISLTDTTYLVGITKPKLFFVSAGSEELVTTAVKQSGVECGVISFGSSNEYESFENFIGEKENEGDFEPEVAKNTDPAQILFSSGTTGMPKATVLGNGFLLKQLYSMNHFYNEVPKILILYSSPYWFTYSMFTSYCILFGATKVICSSFNAENHWSIVNKYKIETVFLAPVHIISSIKYAQQNLISSVKNLFLGGSPISPEYLTQIKDIFKHASVQIAYGMTEIGLVVGSYHSDKNWKTKTNCCGMIAEGASLKIVDPETEEVLGCNQIGELRAKILYPMLGYMNEDFACCYDADGYFKSGDLMYYDEDFCFFFCDRLKEVFKYLSWHIQPAKLESIFETHSDVLLSCVVGIPHPTDDNHIMGFVVLNKNAEATEDELQAFVDNQVDDRYRVRGGVVIIDQMPLTPSGKIKRKELRIMAENMKRNKIIN